MKKIKVEVKASQRPKVPYAIGELIGEGRGTTDRGIRLLVNRILLKKGIVDLRQCEVFLDGAEASMNPYTLNWFQKEATQ